MQSATFSIRAAVRLCAVLPERPQSPTCKEGIEHGIESPQAVQ